MNKFLKIFLFIISVILSLVYLISGYIFFNLIFFTRSLDDQKSFEKSVSYYNSFIRQVSLAKNSDLNVFLQNINRNRHLEGKELIDEKVKFYEFLDSYNNIEELNITSFDNLNLKGYLLKNNMRQYFQNIFLEQPY